jgi:hypothetical protein
VGPAADTAASTGGPVLLSAATQMTAGIEAAQGGRESYRRRLARAHHARSTSAPAQLLSAAATASPARVGHRGGRARAALFPRRRGR